MATREENLKKINAELEAMSDEELSMVAGGSKSQTENDSKLLYEHGLLNNWFYIGLCSDWIEKSAKVDAGWAKAGITCVTKPSADNLYFLNGKQISRDEAWNHVKANFKKINTVVEEIDMFPIHDGF
ncbi:MAG: hypothetical protein IKD80_07690 [Selenomonadaceae bacterium]|nr:hypothetical protein [Selenomonadaceae bacterium]